MEITSLESLHSELPIDGWRRLENYLLNVVSKGQPVNFTTPFFPKDWRSRALDYGQYIKKRFGTTKFAALNSYEEAAALKYGPFSIRLPYEERKEQVHTYFNQKKVTSLPLLSKAIEQVAKLLPKGSLRPLSLEESFANMPPSTNLGLPWFTRNKSSRRDYLERAIRNKNEGWKLDLLAAVLGWRGQPSGTSVPKQRSVWMMDHEETIVGLSIQIPILNALRRLEGFSAWNRLTDVDLAVTKVIDRAKTSVMSVDFSQFDASSINLIISGVFNLFRYWFVKEAWGQIDWLERQFKGVKLATPEGILSGRDGGVPSGSALTNLVDTLYQKILVRWISLMLRNPLISDDELGDDGYWLFKYEPDEEEIGSLVASYTGMKISADKGGISKDNVYYLQRIHMRGYRINGLCPGVRTVGRAWNGVIHRERMKEDLPDEFASAVAIMQLQELASHPNFREVVKYYFSLDKYAREYDPVTIFKRAGGSTKVEIELGLRSFREGEELPSEGLNNFAVVKELRELRSNPGSRKLVG